MNDKERAKAAYNAICEFMDGAKLRYEAREDEYTVMVTVTGDDFPVTLMFTVSEEKQRVETYSQLPFEIRTEKAVDIAMALSAINGRIAHGKFCLYPDRNLCTYEDSEYITGLDGFCAEYGAALVSPAYSTVEEYNDKLYSLNKGYTSVKEFTESLKNR